MTDPNLFPLREGGARAPLFLVAAPGENALGYTALARHLPEGQPAYVVQPRDRSRRFPDEGIGPGGRDEHAVVAAEYLASIRVVQPTGPYHLAGMCDGALIAFQMALLLEDAGERVALLAVLDTWPLEGTSIRALVLAKIVLRRRKERAAAARGGKPAPGTAAGHAAPPAPVDEPEPERDDTPTMPAREHRARWTARLWPGRGFVPPRIGAPIVVLRVAAQPYWRVHDDALGWRSRTAGAVTVHILPGDHQRLLRAPFVEHWVRTISGHLEAPRGGARAADSPIVVERPPRVTAPRVASGRAPGLPPVSAMCVTYARPPALAAAVASFLRQDYPGEKELVVLNDYDGQTLEIDHPEVRVVNVSRRFRTLGEKRNAAAALCAHDLIFVWDDDDISLPHRISLSVRRLDARGRLFRPANAWLLDNGRLGETTHGLHAASCWSRRLFDAAGGYPVDGPDEAGRLEQRLARLVPGGLAPSRLAPEEVFCILRREGSRDFWARLPSVAGGGLDEVEAVVRRRARQGRLRQGRIHVEPRWRTDHARLVAEHLRERATPRGRAAALGHELSAAAARATRALQACARWLGSVDPRAS